MKTRNLSGRQMNVYAPSKSDPICKWRSVSVANIMEMVQWLPKNAMTKEHFRDYMARHYDGDFFHTACQLACQLGLYYEDDEQYIPRFDHDIDISEALAYLRKWMSRYYVPNPFTKRGFINVPPMYLVNALIDYMDNHPNKPKLATAGAALFGGEMGNLSSVKTMLNAFSNVIEINSDNEIVVKVPTGGKIDVGVDRRDKRAFFNNFN